MSQEALDEGQVPMHLLRGDEVEVEHAVQEVEHAVREAEHEVQAEHEVGATCLQTYPPPLATWEVRRRRLETMLRSLEARGRSLEARGRSPPRRRSQRFVGNPWSPPSRRNLLPRRRKPSLRLMGLSK